MFIADWLGIIVAINGLFVCVAAIWLKIFRGTILGMIKLGIKNWSAEKQKASHTTGADVYMMRNLSKLLGGKSVLNPTKINSSLTHSARLYQSEIILTDETKDYIFLQRSDKSVSEITKDMFGMKQKRRSRRAAVLKRSDPLPVKHDTLYSHCVESHNFCRVKQRQVVQI